MFHPLITPRDIAERFHRFLPEEIRSYLKGRGIPATVIDRQLLGWDGERITIPVFDRDGAVLRFRYGTVPADGTSPPVMTPEDGAAPELYGWETLAKRPRRVVVCEGEFDRLVLEARDIAAVSSTAGAATFLAEWAPYFVGVKHVYICFNRGFASDAAAKNVARMLPGARIARLPGEVGEGGTISTFFVELGRTKLDFEVVLAGAAMREDDPADRPPTIREFRPVHRGLRRRAERLRHAVRLHEIVAQFTMLRAEGRRLAGHCPLCERPSSFAVYPETNTYRCSGCGAEGDAVRFLMDKESMAYGQALEALEAFAITHELYGTS